MIVTNVSFLYKYNASFCLPQQQIISIIFFLKDTQSFSYIAPGQPIFLFEVDDMTASHKHWVFAKFIYCLCKLIFKKHVHVHVCILKQLGVILSFIIN